MKSHDFLGRLRKAYEVRFSLQNHSKTGLPMISQDLLGLLRTSRKACEGIGRHLFIVEAQEILSKIIEHHRTSQEGVGRPRKLYFPGRIIVRRYFLRLPMTSQDLLGPPRKAWEGLGWRIFMVEAWEIHSKIIGNHRTSQDGLGRPRKSDFPGRILVSGLPRISQDLLGPPRKAREGLGRLICLV